MPKHIFSGMTCNRCGVPRNLLNHFNVKCLPPPGGTGPTMGPSGYYYEYLRKCRIDIVAEITAHLPNVKQLPCPHCGTQLGSITSGTCSHCSKPVIDTIDKKEQSSEKTGCLIFGGVIFAASLGLCAYFFNLFTIIISVLLLLILGIYASLEKPKPRIKSLRKWLEQDTSKDESKHILWISYLCGQYAEHNRSNSGDSFEYDDLTSSDISKWISMLANVKHSHQKPEDDVFLHTCLCLCFLLTEVALCKTKDHQEYLSGIRILNDAVGTLSQNAIACQVASRASIFYVRDADCKSAVSSAANGVQSYDSDLANILLGKA